MSLEIPSYLPDVIENIELVRSKSCFCFSHLVRKGTLYNAATLQNRGSNL